MKKLIFTLLQFAMWVPLIAQPTLEWEKTYGGSYDEQIYTTLPTSDGGYVFGGYVGSNDGDVVGHAGENDFWIVKIDALGGIEWQNSVGGNDFDNGFGIAETNDGGFVMVGQTYSSNGDVTNHKGGSDMWVVKFNSTGALEWQKTYGGSGYDFGNSIAQTEDGGYIITGGTDSSDGDVMGTFENSSDVWVVKISTNGSLEWQKKLGGSQAESAFSIEPTIDGGFVVLSTAQSDDGDLTENNGLADLWVVKLSGEGVIEWQKSYGGSMFEIGYSIRQTMDGGYVIASTTYSSDGDILNYYGAGDMWLLVLDEVGEIRWAKTFGGSAKDEAFSVETTSDGGYIVSGISASVDGDLSSSNGSVDAWILKLDHEGTIEWQKNIGGSEDDVAIDIRGLGNGDYLVSGKTSSSNGDVALNQGGFDCWVIKLKGASSGVEALKTTPQLEIYPNPATENIQLIGAEDISDFSVTVSNALGQAIFQQTVINGNKLDIHTLPYGLYHLSVVLATGEIVSRVFLKQ